MGRKGKRGKKDQEASYSRYMKKIKNWESAQGNERKTQVPQIWKREKVNGEEKAYAWIYRKWILIVERKKPRY